MATHPDVLIVGGGVIGLTAAYYLAKEGLRVQVIDKGDMGQEASWAGAGILSPSYLSQARTQLERLRAWSFAEYPRLSQELLEHTGLDNGFRQCGGLEVVLDDEAAEEDWGGPGMRAETVTRPVLGKLEPGLAPEVGRAVFMPQMAQLRNPRHLKALIARCGQMGVQLYPNTSARRLERQGERAIGVATEGGLVAAGHVVVATGAWTDELLAPLGRRPGIKPIRGQIALVEAAPETLRHVLMWGERYLVPRGDGKVLIGSTTEDQGFDKRTTGKAIAELLHVGIRLVPALASAAVVRAWAGLRPGSPDGLPFIGPVPGCDNLFVAAGHYRSGIQLAPGTALMLTEMILGKPLTNPANPFRLDR